MGPSELVLLVVVGGLAVYAVATGGFPRLEEGARETGKLIGTVWLPLLLGFMLAGLISVLMPPEVIARHLGEDSGFVGLLVATGIGVMTPGGPYIQFPIVAALHRSGAAPGPLAAYLVAWGMTPLQRTLTWEIPFLGLPFTVARFLVCALLPIFVGLAVPPLLRLLTR